MTPDRFEVLIKVLSKKRPFGLYTVVLHNGPTFEIDFPNALIMKKGLAVVRSPGGKQVIFDGLSVSHVINGPAERFDEAT